MKEYAVTMTNEDGPYFNISADSYEISYSTLNHKPLNIMFRRGNDIICAVNYHYIHEVAEIQNDKYIKLDIPK